MTFSRIQPRFPRRTRQRGAVLLVALIFLILLTLIAIGASSGSLLQQRMVSATRSAQLAMMSADTALRGAEWNLWNTPGLCHLGSSTVDTNTGCIKYDPGQDAYSPTGEVTLFRTGDNAWLSTGIEYKGANGTGYTSFTDEDGTGSPNVADNPRYIIEDMGPSLPPESGPQHETGVTGLTSGAAGRIDIHIYRITARATGGTQKIVRVVQSTFDAQASN